jgi:hypothetical protein
MNSCMAMVGEAWYVYEIVEEKQTSWDMSDWTTRMKWDD